MLSKINVICCHSRTHPRIAPLPLAHQQHTCRVRTLRFQRIQNKNTGQIVKSANQDVGGNLRRTKSKSCCYWWRAPSLCTHFNPFKLRAAIPAGRGTVSSSSRVTSVARVASVGNHPGSSPHFLNAAVISRWIVFVVVIRIAINHLIQAARAKDNVLGNYYSWPSAEPNEGYREGMRSPQHFVIDLFHIYLLVSIGLHHSHFFMLICNWIYTNHWSFCSTQHFLALPSCASRRI